MNRVSLIAIPIVLLSSATALYASTMDNGEVENTVQYRLASTGDQSPFPFDLKGFSVPEPSHIWTERINAHVTIPVLCDQGRLLKVKFKETKALISENYPQEIYVFMHDTFLKGYTYNMTAPSHDIEVNVPQDLTGEAIIKFAMPNACKPSIFDPSNIDGRDLSLLMNLVELTYGKSSIKPNPSDKEEIERYHFGQSDDTLPFKIVSGFSIGEGTHRWSDGTKATLELDLKQGQKKISRMRFLDTSALMSAEYGQELEVSVNGMDKCTYTYSLARPSNIVEINFPLELQKAVINFEMPRACMGCIFDSSNLDGRELAVAFKDIEITLVPNINEEITKYHLGQSDETLPFKIVNGFSIGEVTHRWTDGKQATLKMNLIQGDKKITGIRFLNTGAFIPGDYEQQLDVSVNGMNSTYYYNSVCPSNTVEINFPPELYQNLYQAEINFGMPSACKAGTFDPSNFDGRELAFAFSEVELIHVPHIQTREYEVPFQNGNQNESGPRKRRMPAQKTPVKKQKKDYDSVYEIELAKLIPATLRNKELALINGMFEMADGSLLNIPKCKENRLDDITEFLQNKDDLGWKKNNVRGQLRKNYSEYIKIEEQLDVFRDKARTAVEEIKTKDAAIEKTHSRVNLAIKNKTNTDMTVGDDLQSFISKGKLKKVEITPKMIISTPNNETEQGDNTIVNTNTTVNETEQGSDDKSLGIFGSVSSILDSLRIKNEANQNQNPNFDFDQDFGDD